MNWCDFAIIGIIVVFGIIGLVTGFILSIFKLLSFFLSIFISVRYYQVLSDVLVQTRLYVEIKASILKNLFLQPYLSDSGAEKISAGMIFNNVPLPDFLKDMLLKQIPEPLKLASVASVLDGISSQLAKVVVDVISFVLIYLLVRILLIFVRLIFKGIAQLPIFKQMDKLGGFAFGVVEGLLTVYILCAILMLFHTAPQFDMVFEALNKSLLAKFFYQHNFIVDWMFTSNKVL